MVRLGRARGWVLALGLLAALPAAAQIYKWTDAQGRVHYGDRAGAPDAESVTTETGPGGLGLEDGDERAQQRLLRTLEQERAADKQARRKAAEEARRRQINCAHARQRWQSYRDASYVYRPQPGGGRRILSEPERQVTEQQARQTVRQWCGQ